MFIKFKVVIAEKELSHVNKTILKANTPQKLTKRPNVSVRRVKALDCVEGQF